MASCKAFQQSLPSSVDRVVQGKRHKVGSSTHRIPEVARACLAALGSQLRALKAQILEFDRRIIAWHRSSATSKRLDAIPGVGPALPALVASIADAKAFRSGRDFSAWVGLVPK
jgi:transposase